MRKVAARSEKAWEACDQGNFQQAEDQLTSGADLLSIQKRIYVVCSILCNSMEIAYT